jgi:hypothetical protein
VPAGVAALVTNRVDGHGWDERPRVLLYRHRRAATFALPPAAGHVLARTLSAAWPRLVVGGSDFDAARTIVPVIWRSDDGGRSWTVSRGG